MGVDSENSEETVKATEIPEPDVKHTIPPTPATDSGVEEPESKPEPTGDIGYLDSDDGEQQLDWMVKPNSKNKRKKLFRDSNENIREITDLHKECLAAHPTLASFSMFKIDRTTSDPDRFKLCYTFLCGTYDTEHSNHNLNEQELIEDLKALVGKPLPTSKSLVQALKLFRCVDKELMVDHFNSYEEVRFVSVEKTNFWTSMRKSFRKDRADSSGSLVSQVDE